MKSTIQAGLCGLLLSCEIFSSAAHAAPVQGWLNWRGPQQNGTSLETGLPDTIDSQQPLWVKDFPGQSTAVIANGKLYIMGYLGEGENLQEGIVCFDAETGKELWRQLYNDFLSDTIYLRYGTSSPAIDPETGNIFMQGTQGILASFDANGKELWKRSLMEEFGRLTFPNSRTASPVVENDLVITRGITANWGANGPASDRFYAFDKKTGALVWSSTPGGQPKDNSFSQPYISWLGNKRVLYSATGDGAVVCVNALTSDPIWRVPLTKAGINAAVLVQPAHANDGTRADEKVISIYGTPYEPGQLVALKIAHPFPPPKPGEANVVIAMGRAFPLTSKIFSDPKDVPEDVMKDPHWAEVLKGQTDSNGKFTEGRLTVISKMSGTGMPMPVPFLIGDTNLITPGWKFADGSVAYATNFPAGPPIILRSSVKLWEADISTSTSSPILVGDRVYVVSEKGDLCCVDANSGEILWKMKLGIEERNSCPIYADGKLYVPMLDDPSAKSEGSGESGTKGVLYIIKPGDKDGQILAHVTLEGRCFGTPTAYNGKVYIQTTRHLYCFGKAGSNPGLAAEPPAEKWPTHGPGTQLQIIPSEVLMRPGQTQSFRLRVLDADGLTVEELHDPASVKWASFVPPTAKVKSTMKGSFNAKGELVSDSDSSTPSAGAFEARVGNLKGYIRGRVLPYLPLKQDFEWASLTETDPSDKVLFAYPPLPWIGARFKFEIRDFESNKVLAKAVDNPFFQRATVFIGDPDAKDYTIEADVMTEGNKRVMSEVGVVNQRYYIVLKGAQKKLEINSTQELFRHSVDFEASPNTWYRIKARVDVKPDGSGVVHGKCWKKSDPEPEAWTIDVPVLHANLNGSPGLFSFNFQPKRTYIDNILVTPNN